MSFKDNDKFKNILLERAEILRYPKEIESINYGHGRRRIEV